MVQRTGLSLDFSKDLLMAKNMNIPPLLIFAIDGADASFIERWAQEGYLPTISSIMKRGSRGQIVGPELMSTQGAWLSLFSGASRREHGYYFNRQLVPGTYTLKSVTPRDVDAQPFWSQFQGGSKKVAIIDALDTEPLSNLTGLQLANWAVQQQYNTPILPPSAEPASLLNEIDRLVGSPIYIDVFKTGSTFQEDAAAYRLTLKRIEAKGTLCRRLLAEGRYDLTVVTFVEAHTAAHRFWDYRPGGVRHAEAVGEGCDLGTAIREVYQVIDRELGLLLKQLPDESNVFVISLFGMKDLFPTSGLIEAFCRRLGYQVPVHGAVKSLNALTWLRRMIKPDVRARMSRLLPRSVQRRLETDRFQTETNWAKTRAFSIPALNTSFVRVNLRGREPQGIVDPGSEYEGLLSEIEADLKELVDVRSGEPAVERVIRTADAFGCGPHLLLPDLAVEWKSTPYFMDRVMHPRAELDQAKPFYNRTSYHTLAGFMAAAGPSIPANAGIGELSPLDFAPAFLSLLGEQVSQKHSERLLNHLVSPLVIKAQAKKAAAEVL
jgi:predicted AlkP superfamily phosphohydrolase/phosphomutase